MAAPGAHAAYAPKLELAVNPTTPAAPAALTAKVTQQSGETASKTIKLAFPQGFALAEKVSPCTAAQESSNACPPASQIGSAHETTSLADLTGPVYLQATDAGAQRLALHLSGLGGLVTQKLYADIQAGGGPLTLTIDNMPNTASTLLELDLQGGDKALVVTPRTCGPGSFNAQFTSQNGDQVSAQVPITISGCATAPVVSAVSVRPKSFHTVHTFADTQRPGHSITLRYTLSEATNGTRVKVQRRAQRRWVKSGSFVASGDQGPNSVKFDGLLRGKRLKPGRYRFLVQTTGKTGLTSKPVAVGFTIR